MSNRNLRYSIKDSFVYKRKKYVLMQKPKEALFDRISKHLKIYEQKMCSVFDKDLLNEFSILNESIDSWRLAIGKTDTVYIDHLVELEIKNRNKINGKATDNTKSIFHRRNNQQIKYDVLSFNQALFLILGLNLGSLDNANADVLKNNAVFDLDEGYRLLGGGSIYNMIQQTEEYLWLSEKIKLKPIKTSEFIDLLLKRGIIEKQGEKFNTDDNEALKSLYEKLYSAKLIDGKYQNKWEWCGTGTLLVYLAIELKKAIQNKKIDIGLKIRSVEDIKEVVSYNGKKRLSVIKNKSQKNNPNPIDYKKIDDILAKIL